MGVLADLVSAADFNSTVVALLLVAAAVLVVVLAFRASKLVVDAVGGPKGGMDAAALRAYRRSSAFRQQHGAGYARWARRNGA